MQFLDNILSVSKYESKLLVRSWFFKVFTFIIILFLLLVGLVLIRVGFGGFGLGSSLGRVSWIENAPGSMSGGVMFDRRSNLR